MQSEYGLTKTMAISFPFPEALERPGADHVLSAQENLSYFLECLSNPRRSMRHFAVLILQPNGGSPIWLIDLQWSGDSICGTVASAPDEPFLIGQQLKASLNNILDWLFVHNFRLIGAFSFRDEVTCVADYTESLIHLPPGAPVPTEPSRESTDYYAKIIKFCLPLDEELRDGPTFELFDAIGNHEPHKVRQLISNVQLIDEPCEVIEWYVIDVHRTTLSPLLYAISCDNEDAAVDLIEAGARLDRQDNLGMTALHYAVSFPNLTRLLISNGASLATRHEDGLTALDVAIEGGWHESLRVLIEAGAHVNDYHELILPDSTLRVAVSPVLAGGLDLRSAQILAEAGANFDVKDLDGETPLHKASINGRFDLAEFLVSRGCDATAHSNEGASPISLALEYPAGAKFVDYCRKYSK